MKIPNVKSSEHDYNKFDNSTPPIIEEPQLNTDFSEYMWMENEEEFDMQVMKQLEEEALMEQCIEAMLEDELENKPQENLEIDYDFQKLCVQEKAELAKKSTLNPDAAEFVPRVIEESP